MARAIGRRLELAAEHPSRTLAVAGLVLVAAIVLAAGLKPSASTKLLVSGNSSEGRAGASLDRGLGGEPILMVIEGDLRTTLGPRVLPYLVGVEGKAARLPGVRSVYGPGSFVNETIVQFSKLLRRELGSVAGQAQRAGAAAQRRALRAGASRATAARRADAARTAALGKKTSEYRDLLVRFGSVGMPSLVNANFVQALVYGAGVEPKRRFRWLFPSNYRALIVVRPEPGLQGRQMLDLGKRLRALAGRPPLSKFKVRVAGAPLVAAALERDTRTELIRLAPVAVVAMMLILLLALRRRRGRFIPLGLALGGVALTAGLSRVLGLGLTPATLAALPAVLGLALDFAIQLQSRYWSERSGGSPPETSALVALHGIGPTLGLAGGAMALAFGVMLLSSVPLLDRLGLTLAVGVVASVLLVLAAGPALLVLLDRGPTRPVSLPSRARVKLPGAPRVAVALLVLLAAAGFGLSTQTQLQSDLSRLSPPDQSELKRSREVQRSIGTSGLIRVAVTGRNVTDPAVVTWMGAASRRILRFDPRLKPGPNLADLFDDQPDTPPPTRASVRSLLRIIPAYFLSAVITKDRRTAELSFNVPLVSLSEQGHIVDGVRRALRDPPDGVRAQPAGLLVAGASSTRSLEHSRPWLALLAAAVLAGVLYAFWRDLARVLVVLAPPLLAAGISALVVELAGLQLSPLAAGLELMVLAVGLEFAMLLDMRYRQAREEGLSVEAARTVATGSIGGAMALSAATAAAGFATLIASRLELLSQLGWLVALELGLCAVLALVLVPALAPWSESVTWRSAKPPRRGLRLRARGRELSGR